MTVFRTACTTSYMHYNIDRDRGIPCWLRSPMRVRAWQAPAPGTSPRQAAIAATPGQQKN